MLVFGCIHGGYGSEGGMMTYRHRGRPFAKRIHRSWDMGACHKGRWDERRSKDDMG